MHLFGTKPKELSSKESFLEINSEQRGILLHKSVFDNSDYAAWNMGASRFFFEYIRRYPISMPKVDDDQRAIDPSTWYNFGLLYVQFEVSVPC